MTGLPEPTEPRAPIAALLSLTILIASISIVTADGPSGVRKPAVAVLKLEAKGDVPPKIAAALDDYLSSEVFMTGKYELVNRDQIDKVMREFKLQKSGVCDSTKCYAEIGGAMGAEKLIAGSVSKIGTIYLVNLKLIDITLIKEEFVGSSPCECEEGQLLAKVSELVGRMIGESASRVPSPPPSVRPDREPPAENKAADLLRKVIAAMGGADRIDAVRGLRMARQTGISTPQGEMSVRDRLIYRHPDEVRQEASTPTGAMTLVATPFEGFIVTPAGIQAIPDSRRAEAILSVRRNPLLLVRRRFDPSFSASHHGTSTENSVRAEVLTVTFEGETVRLHVDAATGRILRSVARGAGPGGAPAELVSTYADYRDVAGLVLPYRSTLTADGAPVSSSVVEEITINPLLDDSQFARPGKR